MKKKNIIVVCTKKRKQKVNRDPIEVWTVCEVFFFVAPHERRHYIFIRFSEVPMEAAILFARFRPCSSQLSPPLALFVLRNCTVFYCL